jgi:hypothetical protein
MGVLVTFKIELTSEDIELIGRLLDEQPYKLVAPLAQRVQAQINAQLAPEIPVTIRDENVIVPKKRKGR